MGASAVDASDALANLPPRPLEDTPENQERVRSAAFALSADCDYQEWMRIVFAILSTGLSDASDIADEWSQTADDRYDSRTFAALVRSFKEERHRGPEIGPGTLFHLAKQAGWTDPSTHSNTDDLEDRFTVVPAHQFADAEPARWVIRGLLPQEGIGVLFGEPGSGKSFLALDITAAISRDTDWRGQEVTGGPVVYIAAEGAGGFRKRLRAIAKHQGFALEGMPLGIISDAPNLLKDDDKALARAIKASGGAVLVVIDTLASVTPGANENSAEDMGAVIARCKRLQDATGATVLLVHHSGKDASRGARGWSGLRGAVDVEIEITRKGDDRLAKVTKQKDGEDGALFPFRLLSVDLGQDSDGVPLTSCVVEHLNTVPEGSRREPSGSNQQIVFQVVKRLAPCSVDNVLTTAIEKMPHDPEKRDKRREHAKRALDALVSGKHVICHDQVIQLYGDRSDDWNYPDDDPEGGQL
ncbi:AAA family ATPase [Denitromonas sp.]|uniref:AAA family ATPase n=1 Tax=Denitromonas sp. TaxID=2734609 RepID=UPI002AFEB6EB|nr:AAA family ATPase [Denitromonas sp.]